MFVKKFAIREAMGLSTTATGISAHDVKQNQSGQVAEEKSTTTP